MTGDDGLVTCIERTVGDQLREEARLIASRFKVKPSSFENGIDDAIAAVANQLCGVLLTAFEGQKQRRRRDCDDSAERDRQG